MSNGLKRIAQSAARTNSTVIFINQIRMKIGVMYGNPEVRPAHTLAPHCAAAQACYRLSQRTLISAHTIHASRPCTHGECTCTWRWQTRREVLKRTERTCM